MAVRRPAQSLSEPEASGGEDAASAEEIVQVTAHLHADHRQETTPSQEAVDRITSVVGQPGFVGMLAAVIALWVLGNLAATAFGVRPLETLSFEWLQAAASVAGLLIAAVILTTQRREDQLASHRAQLVLELAVRTDQKLSKVIELLEKERRDNPTIADHVDDQAAAMARPSDPKAVLEAIKIVQQEQD
jgi:uncharacterized membrane protein